MKNILFLLLIIVAMVSCDESYKDSFTLIEMEALKASKVATTSDSVVVEFQKYPIVRIREGNHKIATYYPIQNRAGKIQYNRLNPHK
jgi:hypothetical protein